MSSPEISQRCPSCGVSIRDYGEGILFCPECGKPLASSATNAETVATPGADAHDEAAADPVEQHVNVSESAALPETQTKNAEPRSRTRETLHRASGAARGAIESNVKRAEKIHHVSSVVLEEATYDPSLRFVLVALGLFLLFVILLVLSKVMG